MTGVAHIGGGYWGKNIVRNLHEMGLLSVVCDLDSASLANYKKIYPGVSCTRKIDDVLQDSKVKAVTIATPAVNHYEHVRACLQADKDVFVEKPLALTPQDGEELRDLAQEHGRILMVGHILRYHPAIEKIRELLDAGTLGKLRYCCSNRLNLGKVRNEENILWSFAPHDISVILHLVGRSPDEVHTTGEVILQPGIHDVTQTVLRWHDGVMGIINVSWLHPYKEQKLVLVGDKAMLVFDDTKETDKLALYDQGIDFVKGQAVKRDDGMRVVDIESKEPLRAELSHFAECVRTRQKPKTDADEGIAVLQVLDLAQKSLEKKSDAMPVSDPAYFAHETAVIDPGAQIGTGSKIWHFSHVMPKAVLGKNCSLGQNVVVMNGVRIGNNVKIQNNVSIYDGVILEDNCFCGPSMVFTNVKNPRSSIPRNTSADYLTTHVKQGASMGANCTIVCGVTIGEHAFIAAGAVVTKDVPPHALMAGVPARQIGWMCPYGAKISEMDGEQVCSECERRFELSEFERPGQLQCPRLKNAS